MFCPKCGIEIDEGSVFCSRCGNKLVSDAVSEEKQQTTSSEQETLKRDRNVDVLKPIIIIAAICIAGYFIGNGFSKTPETAQQNSYVETNESSMETVAEAYGVMTEEEKEHHDYDLLFELNKACQEASDNPEITDSPPLDNYVSRGYLEDSEWGWLVLRKMGVSSLSDIEEQLLSDNASYSIDIYRDTAGCYNIFLGDMAVY